MGHPMSSTERSVICECDMGSRCRSQVGTQMTRTSRWTSFTPLILKPRPEPLLHELLISTALTLRMIAIWKSRVS